MISVRPLDRTGPVAKAAWRSTDAVPSWAWRGKDGVATQVEVYTSGDEVELRLNDRRIGRKPTSRNSGHVARFEVRWAPGELVALAYRNGWKSAAPRCPPPWASCASAVGPIDPR